MRLGILAGWLGLMIVGNSLANADDREPTPAEFAPFEHLVGGWKGQGWMSKNRLKGWSEKHNWAWKFVKGKAVGMAIETTGDKVLTKAQLTFDPKSKDYRLEGTDADGKPVVYVGPLDDSTHTVTFDRENPPKDLGKEQLKLSLNENMIRYTLRLFRQEPDAPQYAQVMETGMTKEGESFAAGGAAADLPKCIVTGGAASMTVSYNGKTLPICCSGCRDEFNDNPEKYMKKLAARMARGKPCRRPRPPRRRRRSPSRPWRSPRARRPRSRRARPSPSPPRRPTPRRRANRCSSSARPWKKRGTMRGAGLLPPRGQGISQLRSRQDGRGADQGFE